MGLARVALGVDLAGHDRRVFRRLKEPLRLNMLNLPTYAIVSMEGNVFL
jgi:hypothetical protein